MYVTVPLGSYHLRGSIGKTDTVADNCSATSRSHMFTRVNNGHRRHLRRTFRTTGSGAVRAVIVRTLNLWCWSLSTAFWSFNQRSLECSL